MGKDIPMQSARALTKTVRNEVSLLAKVRWARKIVVVEVTKTWLLRIY